MKISAIVSGLALVGLLASCNTAVEEHKETMETVTEVVYSCPMKCEGDLVYHEAGECPVCGMDLAQIQEHDDEQMHEEHE